MFFAKFIDRLAYGKSVRWFIVSGAITSKQAVGSIEQRRGRAYDLKSAYIEAKFILAFRHCSGQNSNPHARVFERGGEVVWP